MGPCRPRTRRCRGWRWRTTRCWIIGGGAESDFQVVKWLVAFALRRLWALLSGRKAPDEVSFPEEDADANTPNKNTHGRERGDDEDDDDAGGAASASSASSADARSDALMKRLYAAFGLLGVYVSWTIMARAALCASAASFCADACARVFPMHACMQAWFIFVSCPPLDR